MSLIKLNVKTNEKSYPIFIGKNILYKLKSFFKENSINFNQCLIVIDNNVPKKIIKKIFTFIPKKKISIYYFNASEKNKNQKSIDKILSILLNKNFNRNDSLISIGGGITGDVSGFAASIFKRGLKFINIPTTLLSQVDSSIGGKTGINTRYGKNLIGAFYQPNLVISDINFLKTLPKKELVCGYGEILKHAIIYDKKFFSFLDKNGSKILNLKSPLIEIAIYKSCSIKKKVVEADENEMGLRKILNFGHTFAHAYEATLNYSKKLNHGEAVILGIKTAAKFSLLNKILNIRNYKLIENHLDSLNLPRDVNKFFSKNHLKKILSFMKKDKKNNTKKINLVLLKSIGNPIYKLQFDEKKITLFLKKELTKQYLN
jgi:3-dehydroquinate synthase